MLLNKLEREEKMLKKKNLSAFMSFCHPLKADPRQASR